MKTQTTKIIAICLLVVMAISVWFCKRGFAQTDDTLNQGLVMYLSFDTIEEISGQKLIVDESGHENHGTLLSGQIADGKIGNALKCSAINKSDGVRVKDHDSLDLDAVTMAAWIKTEQIDGQWNRILDKGWNSAYNLCIGGDYEGKNWYRTHAQLECAGKPMTSKAVVTDNQWHFVVGTYDGQALRLYIDGKLDIVRELKKPENPEGKSKWDVAAPMKHNNVDIMIGRLAMPEPNPYEHAFFDGLIDEVRLYNRVLSAEEVRKLYQLKNNN